MAARNIGIVFRKELMDTMRDRRMIVGSIIVPLLTFPAMILIILLVAVFVIPKAMKENPTVMLKG